MFVIFFFFHASYSSWPLNQNIPIIYFMTSIYLVRNSLNVTCVGYFTLKLIRSRPRAPPTQIPYRTALGPGGVCHCYHCACYYCSLYHTSKALFWTCFHRLNAAIQKSDSNHHSDKTLLQEWATLLTWSNH